MVDYIVRASTTYNVNCLETCPLKVSSSSVSPLESKNTAAVAVSASFPLESNNLSGQSMHEEERTTSILEEDRGTAGLRNVHAGGSIVKSIITSYGQSESRG